MDRINIAIDGPAGAGKSTIARRIADKLGMLYIDTGAMYRAVALKAVNNSFDTRDKDKVLSILKDISINIIHMNKEQHVLLDGKDVNMEIRTPEISIGASNVAVIPEVRLKLVQIQRKIANNNDVVMDGRDIGSFVLPNANLKIFLSASVDERSNRRLKELHEKNVNDISFEDVKNDIITRDKNDSTRNFAPLIKAEDAIEIDTTEMTIDEVVKKIISLIGK
ncbi:MAG: (d)CMP kinase [Clostridia bacterium]|jgi:cytidylate kinase